MIRYAELNQENVVINIIMATEAQIQLMPGKFIKFGTDDSSSRKEAVISGTYDPETDRFVAPKPYPSWLMSESGDWIPPVERPGPGAPYMWDEENNLWVQLEEIEIDL